MFVLSLNKINKESVGMERVIDGTGKNTDIRGRQDRVSEQV